jgi:cation diffusion facilitator CzcD-associated flavoprotein CzcO
MADIMVGTRVAILGAGPAGVGAAWQLVRARKADAIVVEQRDDVGGNAGNFELYGIPVDYGSHRLHPADYNGFCGSCSTPFIEPQTSKFSSQLSA